MKCSIPGSNVKVFVRAIHCLGKIGDELHFVPLPDGLALRTVNSSRSAFASFLFAPSFFLQYRDGPGQDKGPDGEEEEDSRCKVPMRSILSVFRSPASVEKNVERCKVAVDLAQARLIFTLHCRHGIIKTHSLAIIECETLQAIFSKDSCVNQLCAAPKVLCDAVVNFQNNLEEVTMIAHEEKFILKNFVEDETDPAKVVHTQLSLVPREFDTYKIGEESAITFCLKEFRAILSFAELTALPLQVHFDTAGSPVVFTIDTDTAFNANFVLATLSEPEEVPPGARGAPPSVGTGHPHPTGKQTSGRGKSRQNTGSKGKNANGHAVHRNANCKGLKRGGRGPAQEEDMEEEEEEVIDITTDMTTVLPRRSTSHKGSKNGHHPRSPSSPQPSTSAQEAGSPVFPTRRGRNRGAGSNGERPTSPPRLEERPESPVFMPRQCSTQAGMNASVMADVEENASNDRSVRMELQPDSDDNNDNNEECVPGTPPSKKFRSLFFGSQTSSMMSQTQRQPVVLAPDTDDEDQV